jgi:hypothetical protein
VIEAALFSAVVVLAVVWVEIRWWRYEASVWERVANQNREEYFELLRAVHPRSVTE